MSGERKMRPEGRDLVNRRAFLRMVAGAAIGIAIVGGMLEIASAQRVSTLPQMRMWKEMSTSHPRGGHLYIQTNEVRNAVVHYRWSASGTLTEVERVPTGGAGSAVFTPIYQANGPNALEGTGSAALTAPRRFLITTNGANNSVSS